MYCFIAMIYAVVYNVYFLTQFLTGTKLTVMLKMLFPFIGLVVNFGYESLYIILVVVHVIVALSSGNLILKGKTEHENKCSKNNSIYDKRWQLNLIESLGTRWYISWIFPFIDSPSPGNGVDFEVNYKNM